MNNHEISNRFSTKSVTHAAIIGVTLLWILLYDNILLFLHYLNPIFSSVYVFVGSYLLCLVLVVIAFIRSKPGRLVKIYLSVGLLLALAFPLLLPTLYGQYDLYAKPAPGYEMQWVTQPRSTLSSAFKNAQRAHEKHGCTYTLHGWEADNVLYYGSDCTSKIWRYDPTGSGEPQPVSSIPEGVTSSSVVDRGSFSIGGSGVYPTHPAGFEYATRDDFIVYEKVSSPDRQWVAAAIKNYYGPRDIVILRAKQ